MLTSSGSTFPPTEGMGTNSVHPSPDQRASAQRHFAQGERVNALGQFAEALVEYRAALRLWQHPAFHFKLALAAWQLGERANAITHLLDAVRLDPNSVALRVELTRRLMMDGQVEAALQQSEIALSLGPDDQVARIFRATVLVDTGQPQAAWSVIRPMLRGPDTPIWAANIYARVAGAIGEEPEALELNLKVLERAPAGREKAPLHFTAAALLDKAGRYDEAFEQARLAHAANRRPYDPEPDDRYMDGLTRVFTKSMVRCLPRATHGNSRPVFIVGMPRSGTSLVEQILSSHPAVHGAGELNILQDIATGLNNAPWAEGEGFVGSLEQLSIRRANQLAARYLTEISRVNDTATYVTDKFPLNSRNLWLVQLLFPDAHIIHCVRDPLDTCLSCYMTDFASGNEYAQDFDTLCRFYHGHECLMRHWKRVLDVPILEVRYESVVENIERQTRRMLGFLRLPWDERCLRFYEHRRHVATASQAQVRRPIYRSSVARWRHYQRHLAPLIGRLAG